MNKYFDGFTLDLPSKLRLYDGCHNMIGIVPLTLAGYPTDKDFLKDKKLREYLAKWGRKVGSDSLMILRGDPRRVSTQGYHFEMVVFEPNTNSSSDLMGGISTMCGNGVRAVAAYTKSILPRVKKISIFSGSGLLPVEVVDQNNFSVCMGEVTTKATDLFEYVSLGSINVNRVGDYFESKIPDKIFSQLEDFGILPSWSIGLSGFRKSGRIDGEPHLVLQLKQGIKPVNTTTLQKIAVCIGPIIAKNKQIFPKEININIFYQNAHGLMLATYERNLGNNPVYSVTEACGTGSTFVGALQLQKNLGLKNITVRNTGGDLDISRNKLNTSYFNMIGPAYEIKLENFYQS